MGIGLAAHRILATACSISGRLWLCDEFPESDDTLSDHRLRGACQLLDSIERFRLPVGDVVYLTVYRRGNDDPVGIGFRPGTAFQSGLSRKANILECAATAHNGGSCPNGDNVPPHAE